MNRISTFETGAAVDLIALSVFPTQENQNSLRHIFRYSNWPLFHGSKWALKTTKSPVEALPILQNGGIPVVLCERDLRPGTCASAGLGRPTPRNRHGSVSVAGSYLKEMESSTGLPTKRPGKW